MAIAVIAGVAQYLQRRTDPDASYGQGVSSLFATPAAAVGNAFGWAKAKITGMTTDAEIEQPVLLPESR